MISIWVFICVAIVLLVLFISVLKLQPFISFLLVSLGLGLASGLTTGDTIVAIQKGIGGTLGSIIPIIILGAMIGKMVAKSQATTVIADWLVDVLGQKNLPCFILMLCMCQMS